MRTAVFVALNSKWHAAYCRALLEGDPFLARIYIQVALASINDRLRAAEVPEGELESIYNAIRYLKIIREMEPQSPAENPSTAEKLA